MYDIKKFSNLSGRSSSIFSKSLISSTPPTFPGRLKALFQQFFKPNFIEFGEFFISVRANLKSSS
jgi:hypothetical protein